MMTALANMAKLSDPAALATADASGGDPNLPRDELLALCEAVLDSLRARPLAPLDVARLLRLLRAVAAADNRNGPPVRLGS